MKQRRTTVTDILPTVQANIDNIREFFKYDWSLILSKFTVPPDVDPRVVSLLATLEGEAPWEALFRRLLASKYIALREERWNARNGRPADIVRIPKCYREGPSFLQSEGLWEHREYLSTGLSQGRRARRIEARTGIEGISLTLLPTFSKLPHLTLEEENALIQELLGGSYNDILQLGRDLSPLATGYQTWLDDEMGVLTGLK